jgi:hypothetical protein
MVNLSRAASWIIDGAGEVAETSAGGPSAYVGWAHSNLEHVLTGNIEVELGQDHGENLRTCSHQGIFATR